MEKEKKPGKTKRIHHILKRIEKIGGTKETVSKKKKPDHSIYGRYGIEFLKIKRNRKRHCPLRNQR